MDKNKLARLVENAVQGDKEAFEKLCYAKGQSLLFLCTKIMGNLHDGQDAAQEVFIRMQAGIRSLKDPAAFGGWVRTLAVNTCINMRQKQMKKDNTLAGDDFLDALPETDFAYLPEEYTQKKENKERLLAIVDALPAGMRTCVLLYYFENMTTPEIGEMLGMSTSTVNVHLHRARLKIRAEVEKGQPGVYSHSVVPMGALGDVLQQAAAQQMPVALVQQCLQAAGVCAAATAAGGVAAGTITTFFTGPVLQGLISAAVATGVALTVLFTTASPPLPANVPVAGDPQRLPQTASGYEDTASILDAAIPDAPGPAQTISVPGTGTVSGGAGAVAGGSAGGTSGAGAVVSGKQTTKSEAAATPAAPVTPAVPGQATTNQTAKLKGSVVFKRANGTVIPGGGKYAEGFVVSLENADTVFTRATVDKTGNYQFTDLHISQAGEYSLIITPTSSRATGFAAENPVGSLTVTLQADAAVSEGAAPVTAPVLYITDTTSPQVSISLRDAGGAVNPVNPVKAVIAADDETSVGIRWQVLTADGSQVLYSGTGEAVTTPFSQMRAGGQTGDHILKVAVTDAAGNVTETQQVFCIT